MTRGMGRVKEHEFRFVWINTKSDVREPLPTKGSQMLELGDNTRKSLASCEDATVIYIEREVRIARATETKLKERRSKDS